MGYSYTGTKTWYYYADLLGDVRLITDGSGAVVQRYDYDAFGNIIAQTGSASNNYTYKSKEYSKDSGLTFFGARYYDPLIGRFLTTDPLGMIDGPNMYLYCGNDPINFVDEWGLCGKNLLYEKFKNARINWKTLGWGMFGVVTGVGEIAGGFSILSTPGVNAPLGLVGYSLLQGGVSSVVFGATDVMNSFSGKEPLGMQLFYGTPGMPNLYFPNAKDSFHNSKKENRDIPYWWDRA